MNNNIKSFRTYYLSIPGGGIEEKYTSALTELYDSMPNNHNFEIFLDVGSTKRVSGMKANYNYGFMEMKGYTASKISVRQRTLVSGVWSNWIEV